MLFVATKASLKLPPSTKVTGFRVQVCYHAMVRFNYRKPEELIDSVQLRLGLLNCGLKMCTMGVQKRRCFCSPSQWIL